MTLRHDAIAATLQATATLQAIAPWAPSEAEAYASLDGLLDWMEDQRHDLSSAIYAGNPDLPMGWDYVTELVNVLRKGDA